MPTPCQSSLSVSFPRRTFLSSPVESQRPELKATQTQASLSRSDLIKVLTLYDVTESLGFAQLSRGLDCSPDLSAFLLLGPYLTNRGDSVTVPQMKVLVESLDQVGACWARVGLPVAANGKSSRHAMARIQTRLLPPPPITCLIERGCVQLQ